MKISNTSIMFEKGDTLDISDNDYPKGTTGGYGRSLDIKQFEEFTEMYDKYKMLEKENKSFLVGVEIIADTSVIDKYFEYDVDKYELTVKKDFKIDIETYTKQNEIKAILKHVYGTVNKLSAGRAEGILAYVCW